jgi:hypothetical protein
MSIPTCRETKAPTGCLLAMLFIGVGSSESLCENSDSVILKNEKVVRITFTENKNAP